MAPPMRPWSKSAVGFDCTTCSSVFPARIALSTRSRTAVNITNCCWISLNPTTGPRCPGIDLRVLVSDRHHLARGGDHPIHGAAVVNADVGIAQRRRHVAHVHDIGMAKVDDRIAVRVRGRGVINVNLLPVEVQPQVVRVGHDRQCGGWSGGAARPCVSACFPGK